MRQKNVKTQDIVVWYTENHLTLRQIAKLAGMSAPGVHKRLIRAGILREQGTWVELVCDTCGKPFRCRRAVWRKSKEHFCSRNCVAISLENPRYFQWRQGQRIARAIVSQYFQIPQGAIVHHKDSDTRNNNLGNLAVFASHSDHLKHHHGKSKVTPIWDGSTL